MGVHCSRLFAGNATRLDCRLYRHEDHRRGEVADVAEAVRIRREVLVAGMTKGARREVVVEEGSCTAE